ncbi:phospholipase D-like domain-containing protein [Nocardioides acrostichi]|uniref:phospholipase D n=1 Tax=Nocardioides acrostichi TaxID=2784339 RepID=A0A930Y629_9ACTN|nr:phospholipase D-like domain-containing protein [Nocardioides acrostichi]MBF4161885.1 hypothetical protein [Nocardioides acrostichi]
MSAVVLAATVSLAPADAAPIAVTAHSPVSATGAVSTADAKPTYRVKEGITFNAATGNNATKRAILDHLLQMIYRSRPNSLIKIMTWNFLDRQATDALLKAVDRGVQVHILMDQANDSAAEPNGPWRRLRAGFQKRNKGKKWADKSIARTCQNSCRGQSGAAHAKFYLFPRVGASKKVLVQGGANFTKAAAYNQWNEVYTYVGRSGIYDFADHIFDQMWKDQPVANPFQRFNGGRYGLYFSPNSGDEFKGDPIQSLLSRVNCKRTVKSGNRYHRTIIRSFPDVIRGKRGLALARLLRDLWDRGCDVRVGYTVMGYDVHDLMTKQGKRGPVPIRHMVQDFDGDGKFDNYFHLKVLTVNGRVGADPTVYKAFNGSSNSSGLSGASDENIGTFKGKGITMKYQNFMDRWFNNPPPNANPKPTTGASDPRLDPDFDPYEFVDMD